MKSFKSLLLYLFAAVCEPLRAITYGFLESMGALRYAAHTAVAAHTDTRYYISASLPATYDAAGYGATSITYTEIGKVSDFLPYGSKRNVGEFVPVYGPVEYMKGAPRYGSGDLICGDIPADAGQVIVKAAEASSNHYSVKIVMPDTETHYLDVVVSGWVLSGGKEGTPQTRTATLNICRAPVIVAAS